MTATEWAALAGLIDEWWPGDFTEQSEQAWYTAIGGMDPQLVTDALRRLLLQGRRYRPSMAELVAELRSDPGAPTFSEAFQLIFGRGGVLSARTSVRKASWEPNERQELDDRAALERAAEMHPRVAGFVITQGIEQLRRVGRELQDEAWASARKRVLEQRWDEFVDRSDSRDIAVLAAGGRRGELGHIDPLAAIRGPRKELTA